MATPEEMVTELEETFKNRFTEKDEEYMKVVSKETLSPPVVPDFGRSSRQMHRIIHSEDHYNRSKGNRSRSRSRSPVNRNRVGKHGCVSFYALYY